MSQNCVVCGVYALLKCGGCKNAVYCGKYHQKFDWKRGHKIQCKCFEVIFVCKNYFCHSLQFVVFPLKSLITRH